MGSGIRGCAIPGRVPWSSASLASGEPRVALPLLFRV